ncbi:MAG: peptidoglycan DD-metalloendopeptidase family protein [Bacteroidales bacterium]
MDLPEFLIINQHNLCPLFSPDLHPGNTFLLDLSEGNRELYSLDLTDTSGLNKLIFNKLQSKNAVYAYGGYLEDRAVYKRSPLFAASSQQSRSIHLGIDIWAKANSPVYLPMDGKIHSFRNNDNYGDYGPTIIVEHQSGDTRFYTLYGHLTADSLKDKSIGMTFQAGEILCRIGDAPDNGDWPPHLHFQIIADMQGRTGDFPGVCTKDEQPHYEKICPDPGVFFPKLHQQRG